MQHSTVSLLPDNETHAGPRVGVGVVGLGSWGRNLLRALGDSADFDVADAEVRWICDVDSSRLSNCRRLHPNARVTTRLESILADPCVDAVLLATSADKQYELALLALEAGKHVFVKMPLATSTDLADELTDFAHEHRRIVMCGDICLYSPAVGTILRMIDEGTLGDIYSISSSRVNLGLDQRVGSVVWDLGLPEFSIVLYWLREMPTSIRVLGRDSLLRGVADVAFVTMNFPSGIVVNVELSWLVPRKLRRTVIVGSRGVVLYEDRGDEPVRVFERGVVSRVPELSGEYHPSFRSGDILSPSIDSYEPLELQLDEFFGAILAGDRMEYQTTLARSAVRIAEAAEESLRLGGAEVRPANDGGEDQLLTARRAAAAI